MSETDAAVQKLEKRIRMLEKKLERSEWHRVDLENQHDRDQHLYRRLQNDLEAAKREAEIEAALERTRAQSLQMQHSSELVATSAVFHEQLLALGVPTEFSYVWLPDERAGEHQFWATWTVEEDGEAVHQSKAITYDLDKEEPYTAACFAAWESEERFLVDVIPPADVAHFFEIWEDLVGDAEHLRPERFPDGIYYAEAYMGFGCLGINIRREPTEEERDILRRFAVEFERAYTRFLDLQRAEAQAREAEIEAALERVRSRTMAMQRSDELPEAANLLFEQVKTLGMPAWSAGYCIWDDDKQGITAWMSSEGVLQPPFHAPLTEDAYFMGMREGYDRGVPLHVHSMGGEALVEHYQYMRTLPVVGEILDSIIEAGHPLPTFQINHCAYFAHGFLLFITYEPVPEAHDIFQRFATVFDQTYTRYLDLERAEEQAREAQVEAALERVRSRTMAMHASDELREVVAVTYAELQGLGFPSAACILITRDEAQGGWRFWMSNRRQEVLPEPYFIPPFDHPVYRQIRDGWDSGVPYQEVEMDAEQSRSYTEALFEHTELGRLPEPVRAAMRAGRGTVLCEAFTPHSILEVVGKEPLSEGEAVLLRRFAHVFDQAYTRFLDLEQAEAQAREAEIEAALERVRSRTMAMRSSDELAEVSRLLNREVVGLGTKTWGCAFNIYGEDESTEWFGTEVGPMPTYPTPREGFFLTFYEKGQEGDAFHVEAFEGEACTAHYEYMLTLPVLGDMLADIRAAGHEFPTTQYDHVAYFKYGYLLFITLEPAPEAHDIFRRFAKVFEQTYTRFLDLQRAEERAREAQIEAALERIRSKALEMAAPEDLLDVVFTLHREYAGLGFDCGAFWHTRYTPEVYRKALTSIDGQKLAALMELPRDFASNPALEAWERGSERVGVFPFCADAACEYLGHMIAKGKYREVDPEAFTEEMIRENGGWTFVQARTSHGEIGYSLWGETEPTEEAKDVLVRFATTFDLAYRRFLDLQKAEADHRALVEEKAATDRALAELRAAQARLVQSEKMASLGALTAGIAHEIKNPLNFVTNFASLSRELLDELAEGASEAERAEILADLRTNAEKIEEHGKRADGIVRSMMEHARSGTGERCAVDLNALVREYAGHAEHAQRARHPEFEAALTLRLGDGVGAVEAVPQEIGRVLVNLVDNALDAVRARAASENGAYAPAVTVSTRRSEAGVEVRVSDNGPGMPEAVRAKVFEPFFTTKPTGEGTGLGLSLAHDIVAQGHGGALSVESQEGEGATFVLALPTTDRP